MHLREPSEGLLLTTLPRDMEYIFGEMGRGAMIPNELIQYDESLVGRQRPTPAEQNPHLREFIAEIRDAWESRVILRDLRNRAGIATHTELSESFHPWALCQAACEYKLLGEGGMHRELPSFERKSQGVFRFRISRC
jgi:hypothetical protein